MASVVDVCNAALAQIGQKADVTSIDPPDGSAYAAHCARFYPIARDLALEEHAWTFAVKRWELTESVGAVIPSQWEYAFTLPSDMILPLSVLPDEYGDESRERMDYEIEDELLFANDNEVWLKYIARVTDVAKWTPSFRQAVSWKLAGYLAGVTVKGDTGLRKYCDKKYQEALLDAMGKNAMRARTKPVHTPVWMSDR